MKKLLLTSIFIVILFFSVFGKTQITFVCDDKENFPEVLGNSMDLKKGEPGIAVELMNLLAKKLDLDLKIERVPITRAIESKMKKDKADGLFFESYNPKAANCIYPMKNGKIDSERKYKSVKYVFYKLKDSEVNWDGKKLTTFEGSIGMQYGYSITEDVKKLGYEIDYSYKTQSDLQKLFLGRVQLVIAVEEQGDSILEKNPELNRKIEKIEIPFMKKDFYLVLNKKFVQQNPILAEEIWDTLSDLKNTNYKKLSDKYYR